MKDGRSFKFQGASATQLLNENDAGREDQRLRTYIPGAIFAVQIIADIKAALTTYGTGGVYCGAKGFSLKLDVTVY